MSLYNPGKITASERLGKRRGRRARGYSLLLSVSLPLVASCLLAVPPFERDAFNQIIFTGSCSAKDWSLSSDQSLELILAPIGNAPCEARLDFSSPQDINKLTALRFEAQSSHVGPFLK